MTANLLDAYATALQARAAAQPTPGEVSRAAVLLADFLHCRDGSPIPRAVTGLGGVGRRAGGRGRAVGPGRRTATTCTGPASPIPGSVVWPIVTELGAVAASRVRPGWRPPRPGTRRSPVWPPPSGPNTDRSSTPPRRPGRSPPPPPRRSCCELDERALAARARACLLGGRWLARCADRVQRDALLPQRPRGPDRDRRDTRRGAWAGRHPVRSGSPPGRAGHAGSGSAARGRRRRAWPRARCASSRRPAGTRPRTRPASLAATGAPAARSTSITVQTPSAPPAGVAEAVAAAIVAADPESSRADLPALIQLRPDTGVTAVRIRARDRSAESAVGGPLDHPSRTADVTQLAAWKWHCSPSDAAEAGRATLRAELTRIRRDGARVNVRTHRSHPGRLPRAQRQRRDPAPVPGPAHHRRRCRRLG